MGRPAHVVHRGGLHRRPDARGDRRIELLTGNMALVPLALMQGKIKVEDLISKNFTWVLAGNLLGALFVAYFLGVQSGVLTARPAVRAAQRDRSRQGHRGDRVADLPARDGLQLARLPRRVDGARRRRRRAARSSRSSSRSWPSWRWASTTWSRTCSSCPPRSSRTSPTYLVGRAPQLDLRLHRESRRRGRVRRGLLLLPVRA